MDKKFSIDKLLKSDYVKELINKAREEAKDAKEAKKDIEPLQINDYHNDFIQFINNVNKINFSSNIKLKLNKLNELFIADNNLNKELDNFYNTEQKDEYKNAINNLVDTLQKHQKKNLDIKPPTSPPPNTKLINLINEKIKKLDEISDQRFLEAKEGKASVINPEAAVGGSISTNNSIRKQIFTDLKYITKYLKYKTKYIVFKSKH